MVEYDEGSIKSSMWQQRAWTFQEDIFSPRKLVFYGETVQWKCLCAKWTEGMVNIGQIQLRNGFNVQLRSTGLLPIVVDRANEDYENIVRKYNYRHLI